MSLHPSSTRLRALAAWGLVIVSFCALLNALWGGKDVSEGARLLLSTRDFEPGSQLRLVFDEDMASPAELRSIAVEPPLRIAPELRGHFVWLSPREGVYTLGEVPRMNTTYRFRLATGLRDASGRVSGARLHRELKTPAFDVANVRTSFRTFTNNSSRPVVHVAFNENVTAAAITPFCEFHNGRERIPAKLTGHHRPELPGYWADGNPGVKSGWIHDAWSRPVTPHEESPIGNAVRIEPQEILPAGDDWRLVLRAGLPTSDTRQRLAQDRVIRIGHVPGMTVREVYPENAYSGGRQIVARLTGNPAGVALDDWVSVEPRPANLQIERRYRAITLRGAFELSRDYRVTVHAGLKTRLGDRLPADFTETVRFKKLPPRVLLAAEDVVQYAGGAAGFEFLAYNAERVRLRYKMIPPDDLVHVLRGYRDRVRNRENERDYPFGLIPGGAGRSLHFGTRAPVDKAARTTIDLHRIAGGRGVFFLDLQPTGEGGHVGAQSLVQLTDLGLLWKHGADGWRFQVFSLREGIPVPHADIALVDDENQALATGRCDREGVLDLPAHPDARWVKASTRDDVVALRLRGGRIHRSGVPTRWRPPSAAEVKMLLFTDRSVYEPGDDARLKGIVRLLEGQMELPDAEVPVVVTLFDSRGSAVVRTNLPLSAAGSFDWAFRAPDKRRGRHRLAVRCLEQEESTSFLVQDFEPDAFEVSLGGAQEFAAGEPVEIPVSARYLFGTPLSDAKLRWVVEAEGINFQTAALPDFVFGENVGNHRVNRRRERRDGKGTGRLTRNAPAIVSFPVPTALHPLRVNLEVEVTDLNQQTIIGGRSVVAHASDFYLGVQPPQGRPRAGGRPILKAVAVNADGAIKSNSTTAAMRLDLIRWRSFRVAGAGGSIDYRNEWNPVEVATNRFTLTGVTELQLPELPEAGEYLLTLTSHDAGGRAVETRTSFHVSGADTVVWDYKNAAELKLTPDRESYLPGDTARLLLESPIDGTAYVTLERERAHLSFTTNISGGAPVIHVPLRREDAPNVFASVTVIRGGQDSPLQHPAPEFRHGYAQLKVDTPATQLAVAVELDREEYRPGETIRVECSVRNQNGRAARGAEVTLYAVDEGVLNLTGDAGPEPHTFFHARRRLAVQTHLSLSELLPENPADLRFHNKGYVIGGGGRLPGVRQAFTAVPLWLPALKTGRDGRVTAGFRAPDSLTRYRIIAIAHSRADRFGNGQTTAVVNQPLMIKPVLPQFARVGDRIDCRALIVNRTAKATDVKVTRTPGNETRDVSLAAGEAKTVAFPTTFTQAGPRRWVWTARSRHGASDTVTRTLNVAEAMPRRSQIVVGRVTGTTNLLTGIDPSLPARADAVAGVALSTSPLVETLAGIEYLLHYPYGCVEQTSSSLLPWLLVARVPGLGGLIGKSDAEITIAADAGVRRLFSMQTGDGGLSYWPGGRSSMFWGSAYAAFVLAHAEAPPTEEWRALLHYLRARLLAVDPADRSGFNQAHALGLLALALAGEPLPELHRRLHERRETLSAETRALIALAENHSAHREELSRGLLTWSEVKTDQRHFSSRIRRLAIEAMAWRQIDSAVADTRLDKLASARRNGQWSTTQGNAWALLALTEKGDQTKSISISGRLRDQPFVLPPDTTITKTLPPRAGGLILQLTDGESVYAQLRVSAPIDPTAPPENARGFELTREYERLNGPGEWQVGDSILVTLTLNSARRAEYVAIDDPLPAVLEAVVPEFKSRSAAGAAVVSPWFSSHQELRRDRALFFRDRLPAGRHVIRYVARVRAAGRAIAPPAKVERMYAPDEFGTTATRHVEARP